MMKPNAVEWDRPVFSVGSRTITIQEVLRAAHFRGELDLPWAWVCWLAEREDLKVDAEAVQASSEEFRSGRDLITSEETEHWLEERGLALDDFGDFFIRSHKKAMLGGTPPEPAARCDGNAPEEFRDMLRVDLLMSGEFDLLAERLAWRFAAYPEGAERYRDWALEMRELEDAFQAQRAALATGRAREQVLQFLRLPLTRFQAEVLEVECRDAAHEALLCLREDGATMEEVARDGRYPLRRAEWRFEELPPEMQPKFPGASPGEVLGPFARGEGWQICRLLGKEEPSLTDDAVRMRVDRQLCERHFSELAAQHIQWMIAPSCPHAEASR